MCAKLRIICAAVSMSMPLASSWAVAQESAIAEEVIKKAQEAADYLAKSGEAGLEAFKTKNSPFVWKKDGYVVVIDCAAGEMLAHPIRPGGKGAKLSSITDDAGTPLGKRLCEAGEQPKGGWVEFRLTKPGEHVVLRKIAYVRPVEGTSYEVSAGFYDDAAKVDDLQKLSDAQYLAAKK
jgi:cytochrome c